MLKLIQFVTLTFMVFGQICLANQSNLNTQVQIQPSIYCIGDSTMADKPTDGGNPERGWCQALSSYCKTPSALKNHAVNGRSSKSFINEGRWDAITKKLKKGDWVLIQFGHNDQKSKSPERYTNPYSGFRMNLVKFIEETREKGAHPILMSSIVRRHFNKEGTLCDTHGAYPFVTLWVARNLEVPFVDMQWMTEKAVNKLGPDASKSLYMCYEPRDISFFPEGKTDNTHLNPKGADSFARLFLTSIYTQNLKIADLFNEPTHE